MNRAPSRMKSIFWLEQDLNLRPAVYESIAHNLLLLMTIPLAAGFSLVSFMMSLFIYNFFSKTTLLTLMLHLPFITGKSSRKSRCYRVDFQKLPSTFFRQCWIFLGRYKLWFRCTHYSQLSVIWWWMCSQDLRTLHKALKNFLYWML